ncbi:hypothetical protein [Microcoleus phage My-WqHQDG]|nr:hypothetical protein [Microcoleus phage My-WqHQDG]
MTTNKSKVQYMLQIIKSTNQVLVSLPAFYFAYMGFNSLGWITYTSSITSLYEVAAYPLWLEMLVTAIYLVVTTAMKVIKD